MVLDIIFAVVLLLAFIHGFSKGLIHSIVSLLAIVIGIMAAVYFSEVVSVYLDKWFNIGSKYLPFISFIVAFTTIYLLFRLVEKMMVGFFKLLKLNFLNKLAGALVWCIICTMLFSTLFFYGNNIGAFTEELKSESVVYEKVEPFAPQTISIIGKIIPPVKNIFTSLQEWFEHLKEKESLENQDTEL